MTKRDYKLVPLCVRGCQIQIYIAIILIIKSVAFHILLKYFIIDRFPQVEYQTSSSFRSHLCSVFHLNTSIMWILNGHVMDFWYSGIRYSDPHCIVYGNKMMKL